MLFAMVEDAMVEDKRITLGGERGHIEEAVKDPLFITLYNAFRWKMIPNCTGRTHAEITTQPPI